MKSKPASLLLFGIVLIWLLAPALARAQQTCDESCSTDIGCYGGCSISVDAPCSAVCWNDGCGATCQSFGSLACKAFFTVHCTQKPTKNSQPSPEVPAGWALVRYELPATAALDPRNVLIVSASSDAIARFAQTDSAKRENQAMADRIAADSADSDATAAPLALGWQTSFIVVPSGPCERVRARLTGSRNLAEERPEKPENVYFRATTNSAGRISSMEVLYTDASEPATRRIVAFGKENLQVWSPDKPNLPLQVYGLLRVYETGNVSAGALAGSPLF